MTGCVHMSSLIVHAQPDRLDAVCRAVAENGGEVAACDARGKIVAVVETPDEAAITSFAEKLATMTGVFSANLAFHLVDDLEPLEQPFQSSGETS